LFGKGDWVIRDSGIFVDEFLDWGSPSNQNQKRSLGNNEWKVLQGGGMVEGVLWGGCLEVIEGIKNTELFPTTEFFENKILFLEVSEWMPGVEWVEMFVRNLCVSGIACKLKALLFGRPHTFGSQVYNKQYEEALVRVLGEEFGLENLLVVSRMDFGHTKPSCVLPIGGRVIVDSEKNNLRFSAKKCHRLGECIINI